MASNQTNQGSGTWIGGKPTPKLPQGQYVSQNYTATRQTTYPNTHQDQYPSAEAQKDHQTYSARTQEANASTDAYRTEYTRQAGSADISTLSARQHSSLSYSAAEAALETQLAASGRYTYLNNHPYGYYTTGSRQQHETYFDHAKQDAEYHRSVFDQHKDGGNQS